MRVVLSGSPQCLRFFFLRKLIILKVLVVDRVIRLLSNIQISIHEVKLRSAFIVVELAHNIVKLRIFRGLLGLVLSSVRHFGIGDEESVAIEKWQRTARARRGHVAIEDQVKRASEVARDWRKTLAKA
jgi:hypothetical protein